MSRTVSIFVTGGEGGGEGAGGGGGEGEGGGGGEGDACLAGQVRMSTLLYLACHLSTGCFLC